MSRYGWESDLPTFRDAIPADITARLGYFVLDADLRQIKAWRRCVPWLQRECGCYITAHPAAEQHHAVLEYELPRDFRRPDVIVLRNGTVIVIEIKGAPYASQAALDQVSAYARDLKAYHRACEGRVVVPVLVTSAASRTVTQIDGVYVLEPSQLCGFLVRCADESADRGISADEFLLIDAYAPLPTIVQAARDLFHKRPLPKIKRALANTEPAIEVVTDIAHKAAQSKTRHLVLISGVPGAGKTLVGLQLVHAGWLDDLAVSRQHGKPSVPAVYLSGNGPLVEVLQHALRDGGGGGKTFVQDIKKYVAYYAKQRSNIPPEHLLVFDEAQRAHDAERVAHVHRKDSKDSEPKLLIEFCSRIPEWSVLVGLIGTGQAIHVGEEGGLPLWAEAIQKSPISKDWLVHCSSSYEQIFRSANCRVKVDDALNLDSEVRFHLAAELPQFVDGLLDSTPVAILREVGTSLFNSGYRFLITRNLDRAKNYFLERYSDAPTARYGLLASSKDKWLVEWRVDNTYQTTKRLRVGPWYNDPPFSPTSCCQLETVATEFSSQGLELDAALIAWGSDLLWDTAKGEWHMRHSRGTRGHVVNPLALRKNVYRVLLTRGRDAAIVFCPEDKRWDSTYAHLSASGFRSLD